MDKPRDAGRGASWFSTAKRHMKPSGHKLIGFQAIGGRFQFSEKSKEKVRSLSAFSRALSNCRMGCNISEKSDAFSSQTPSASIIASKRFKIPRKIFYDCNGVDHASVPRKLRSAMRKRNRESIFPDSQKVVNNMDGIKILEKDRIKKSKKHRTPDCSRFTEDEEEVAETLYALAGMFPDNGLNCKTKLDDGMSLPENSILPDFKESPSVALQGTGQNASPSCTEISSGEAAETCDLHKTSDQGHADFPESSNLMASDSGAAASKMNLQTMRMLAQSEYGDGILLHDSEFRLAIGQSQIPHIETKQEIASATTRAVEGKQEHHMIKDKKRNEAPALWPSLSPAATTGNHVSILRSTAAKAHLWLDTATCHSKQGMTEGRCCGGKVSVVAGERSWKRSTAHVYISRLIQSLQVPNGTGTLLKQTNQPNEMRVQGESTYGFFMEVHDLSEMRNEAFSTPGMGHSACVKNSYAIENYIFQRQSLYNDTSRTTPTSEVHNPQKQRFDFLSLSVGGSGLNDNNDYSKVGSKFEPLLKLQVPYLQSPAQQHGLLPFPVLQSQDAYAYRDQISVVGPQDRMQLPHYYGTPLRGIHSAVASSKQRQSFCAGKLAAQSRSAVNCSMATQYPNCQSGRRQDSSVINPCAQAIIPPSHVPASLEVLRPKITSISQQQQHLIALAPSFPISRRSGVDFHLPYICEESRVRFHSNVTPSRQLLSDERI